MEQLEKKYKKILQDVRNDSGLLAEYAYESSKDGSGNQAARKRLLVSLLNFKESSDYEIASYLFDEEVKAKQACASNDNYDHDLLDLSALVLISFKRIDDLLRMAGEHHNVNEHHEFLDPHLYVLYGAEKCYDFLNNSFDLRAQLILKKLSDLFDTVDEVDVPSLQEGFDEYFENFYFPIKSRIDFCIDMKEVEILEQEADSWFDSVNDWNLSNLSKGNSIAKIIDDSSFSHKMKAKENRFAKILFSVLSLYWYKVTVINEEKYFKTLYLSGKRTPDLSWRYYDDSWSNYAQEKFDKINKYQRISLIIYVVVATSLCLFFYDPELVAFIFWFTSISILFFFTHIRKEYLLKRQAYLQTKPATLEIYDRGLVVGSKHYLPFNTNDTWLLGIGLIEKEGSPYIEIKTNPRAGKNPNANIFYHTFPVPKGKEDEARHYASKRRVRR